MTNGPAMRATLRSMVVLISLLSFGISCANDRKRIFFDLPVAASEVSEGSNKRHDVLFIQLIDKRDNYVPWGWLELRTSGKAILALQTDQDGSLQLDLGELANGVELGARKGLRIAVWPNLY